MKNDRTRSVCLTVHWEFLRIQFSQRLKSREQIASVFPNEFKDLGSTDFQNEIHRKTKFTRFAILCSEKSHNDWFDSTPNMTSGETGQASQIQSLHTVRINWFELKNIVKMRS